MTGRIPEWGLALVVALAAHVALAIGLGGRDEARIERGPGDGGPIVMGSLIDSITGDLEAEEASEADEATETEEVLEAADTPDLTEVSEPEAIRPAQDIPPVNEMPEIAGMQPVEAVPVTDAPPVMERLAENTVQPEDMPAPEPDEVSEPVADAVMPPLPREVAEIAPDTPLVEEAPKPEIKPAPVRKMLVRKKPAKKTPGKKNKIKKRARRGANVDSRRGGSGGRGRAGGGGRGLGGRAMMSNYKGRVVAHLRRYKAYPAEARRRGIKGLARVRFTINSAGRVINSRLVSSSGSAILDRGARATIRRANPFPSLPKGLGKTRMTFVVPIRFNTH